MKKIFLGIVIVGALLVVGFFALNSYIYNEKQADEDDVSNMAADAAEYTTFTDQEVGVSFEYKTSPDGYVIDDMSENIGEAPGGAPVMRIYSIVNAREKAELEASTGGREGPPTIHLTIYRNDENQSANRWVDAFPTRSNSNLLIGEIDGDAVVGGANAVRYFSDGLYVSENVAVAHGGFIYHFSGSFLERDSTIHQDFKTLIDSVTFIEISEQLDVSNAKIDVRAACQSALAYMLFQSSEQSDQFLEECVAGMHPDIIERYIESLGLDGATI